MSRSSIRSLSVGVAVLLVTSGCFGPFNLTRRVYHWNAKSSDKWEREFVFLLLTWAPVYGVAGLADAILFNSLEFWGAQNPISPPAAEGSSIAPSRRISRGAADIILTRAEDAKTHVMTAELYLRGTPQGAVRFERRAGEPTVAKDEQGRTLFAATTLADGGIEISDGRGKQAAIYAPDDVERVLRSATLRTR